MAIRLLALSNDEICRFVTRELEQNPLLECDDGNQEVADSLHSLHDRESLQNRVCDDAGRRLMSEPAMDSQVMNAISRIHQNLTDNGASKLDYIHSPIETVASTATQRSAVFFNFERGQNSSPDDWVGSRLSFYEYIDQEINLEFKSSFSRNIAHALASYLDGAGYLTTSVEKVANKLNCSAKRVTAVLERLQRFEPPGLFARTLKECLSIQLVEKNALDPVMQTILENLPLLASVQLEKLAGLCKRELDEVVARVVQIQKLNPKPLLTFDDAFATPLEPDLILHQSQSGDWVIELNDKNLPKVAVNDVYSGTESHRSVQDQQYLEKHRKSANWLVRSLRQRGETMIKVATAIVERQHEFFIFGVAHMRPLSLKDIALVLNLHESTISRATKNKFIQTPSGTFELNYFFSQAVGGRDKDDVQAATAVRHRIQSLVEAEEVGNVLSDDNLAKKLSVEGIEVARRTVTKYRELLKIPSSTDRKRRKKLTLSTADANVARL